MNIGLFFGSFNPVHTGHLVVAEYILEFSDLDEVWFVVSPQNPLKEKGGLVSETDRVNMVRLALPEKEPRMKLCKVELDMPRPSYTLDTLNRLTHLYPGYRFVVLMGSDSVDTLPRWKGYEKLISDWDFYVYPREAIAFCRKFPSNRFKLVDAPMLSISSTQIRHLLAKGLDVSGYVPDDVWDYIARNRLYGIKMEKIHHEDE